MKRDESTGDASDLKQRTRDKKIGMLCECMNDVNVRAFRTISLAPIGTRLGGILLVVQTWDRAQ